MRNSLNFDKTLPSLTALTPMKPPFFVLSVLFNLQVSFEVFIADLDVVLLIHS